MSGPLKRVAGEVISIEDKFVLGLERVDGGVIVRHEQGWAEIPLGNIFEIHGEYDKKKK